MRRIICPNAKNCTIYEYWIDQAGGQRIGIISESGEGSDRSYSCLALDVYNDRDLEGGVVSDEEGHLEMFITNGIEDVLPEDVTKNINFGRTGCANIVLLNKQ